MKKAVAEFEVRPPQQPKPLPGQGSLLREDETPESGTTQVTIRVSTEALRILTATSKRTGVKRNRLFDEAVQAYAAVLVAGMRIGRR